MHLSTIRCAACHFKMKKFTTYLVLFSVVFHFLACNNGNELKSNNLDSESAISLADSIMLTYGYNPEKALLMLDSAEQSGGLSEYLAKLFRGKILANSVIEQHLDSALAINMELLHHDSVVDNPAQQENVLNQLIDVSRKRHDDEQYLKWSLQKAELCRQQGEETELLRTEAEIGLVLTHLGQVEDGLAKLRHSFQKLDVSGSVDKMDAFIVVTKRLITALGEQHHLAEVVPLVQQMLKRLDDYEEHPGDYVEDSYRLSTNKEDRARYIDFCQGQAYGFLVNAYAEQSDRQQAFYYLDKISNTQYGSTFSAQRMLCPAYLLLGEYDKLLETYDGLIKQMGSDTVNVPYANILHGLAVVADSHGQIVEGRDYWRRYAQLSKVLNDSINKSKAHQYAAHYHAQEQQMELELKEEELRRMNIYIAAAVLLAFLGISFAFYFFYRRRIDNKKNKIIVNQISDSIRLKQIGDEMNRVADNQDTPDIQSTPTTVELNEMSNEELYVYLSGAIVKEKLYLDPYFDRQAVMKYFHLSERRVGAAFSKGSSEYKSLPGFVREQRLLYACKLLQDRTELSFKEVAAAAGFSSQTRFNIDFKERFSFSPSEYVQLLSQK